MICLRIRATLKLRLIINFTLKKEGDRERGRCRERGGGKGVYPAINPRMKTNVDRKKEKDCSKINRRESSTSVGAVGC